VTSYVALYCRISVDRAGRREGVRNQERWGRAYATERWPGLPVQVFVDNDLSAASGGPRPAFTALREAVRAGQVARLWAVEQSRLERTEVGWFELAAELDAAGIGEVHTLRDGIVRVTDEVAGIKAVLAAAEARKLRQRTRDKLASNAAAGIPPPSRPYGFRRVANEHGASTYEHDPEQARVVREVADKVLSGWSLTNIARHLTATGVRGAKGGVLNSTSVRSIVTTPAVAGLRVHQGRVVGRGNWAPILDEAAWRACCARLAAPRVVEQVDGTPYPVPAPGRSWARRYLLTRFAFCAVCGARLVGTLKQTRRRGASSPYYQCAPKYGGRACVGIKAEPTEAHVLGELMRKLATPAFVAALSDDGHSQRRDQLGA
jgi:DNA invertase Pin-like site-specific DNA recombinase